MITHPSTFSQDEQELTIIINETIFDASVSGDFKAHVETIWKNSINAVIIDFSQVEFIDSSGIGALLSVHKRLQNTNGAVTILNAQPLALSVIELLRLHRVFNLKND